MVVVLTKGTDTVASVLRVCKGSGTVGPMQHNTGCLMGKGPEGCFGGRCKGIVVA
jgi:hypothetical protein